MKLASKLKFLINLKFEISNIVYFCDNALYKYILLCDDHTCIHERKSKESNDRWSLEKVDEWKVNSLSWL